MYVLNIGGKIDTQKSLNWDAPQSPLNASNPELYSMITIRNRISLESKIAFKFNFKLGAKLFLDRKY